MSKQQQRKRDRRKRQTRRAIRQAERRASGPAVLVPGPVTFSKAAELHVQAVEQGAQLRQLGIERPPVLDAFLTGDRERFDSLTLPNVGPVVGDLAQLPDSDATPAPWWDHPLTSWQGRTAAAVLATAIGAIAWMML